MSQTQTTTNHRSLLFPDDFFIPIDADTIDAVSTDSLAAFELLVLIILHRQVDFKTGVWRGTATRIAAALGGIENDALIQKVQRALKSLREKNFIVVAERKRGQRGRYPVAILGYKVRRGKYAGHAVDAKTIFPAEPIYTLVNALYRNDCITTVSTGPLVLTHLPDTELQLKKEGRKEGVHSEISSAGKSRKSKPKSLLNEVRPQLHWAWGKYWSWLDSQDNSYSTVRDEAMRVKRHFQSTLNMAGYEQVKATWDDLRNHDSNAGLPDLGAGLLFWLKGTFTASYGGDNPIRVPLAIFARDMVAAIDGFKQDQYEAVAGDH